MTSGGKRRLDRLQAALVPVEALALWLREVRKHYRSLEQLVHSLQRKPEEAFPLFTLTQQGETAARARAKQQGPGESDVRRARLWSGLAGPPGPAALAPATQRPVCGGDAACSPRCRGGP